MKINQIQLKNFKRFHDLIIEDIPDTAKLVLLIGSNGSGKSCVFDAFEYLNTLSKGEAVAELDYYKKEDSDLFINIKINNNVNWSIESDKNNVPAKPDIFYGRSSFRQVARIDKTTFNSLHEYRKDDADRPKSFIDKDNRFENDIEYTAVNVIKDIFQEKKSSEYINNKYIHPINDAFERIFGNDNGNKLSLLNILPPFENKSAQVNFKKGTSEIPYDYLSAGEKEVFNILFNLLIRSELFQDTIYFFDEIDLHLNTRLQYRLLQEITENWIPDNCQFWTASHSLGFIEYANRSEHAAIIDFDDYDFDLAHKLRPAPKEDTEIYEVAVGKEFLSSLFQDKKIYFVENKDKKYYGSIGITDTVFISDNSRNTVYHKVKNGELHGIVDRDFLSDHDIIIIKKQYPNLRILNYYSIENYMYHPDNLEEYYIFNKKEFNKTQYITSLKTAKNKIKQQLILSLVSDRMSYPYFGEPAFNGDARQQRFRNQQANKDEALKIAGYLNSEELEIFYKALPMKTYCTQLSERQHIPKTALVKTKWFRSKIKEILLKH